MFAVTETEAAMIRAAYEQGGERAAVAKLMHLFPAITHPARARRCVRILANWKPLTMPPAKVAKRPPGKKQDSARPPP